jgi:hypothetical protein
MILLILLFVKHWYVDFVLQTQEMVDSKGIYGSAVGIHHSLQHAAFTLALLLLATNTWLALVLAIFDGLMHYHIDWLKMNYGNRDINSKQFWVDLGLDQLAHAITYIWIFSVLTKG